MYSSVTLTWRGCTWRRGCIPQILNIFVYFYTPQFPGELYKRICTTGTCFIQKIYTPSSSLLQGEHLLFSPSPLCLNIFRLFVILSLTQSDRYTPEIFLFSTATFKYAYRAPLRRIGQEYSANVACFIFQSLKRIQPQVPVICTRLVKETSLVLYKNQYRLVGISTKQIKTLVWSHHFTEGSFVSINLA
jgi:hypothetical protein